MQRDSLTILRWYGALNENGAHKLIGIDIIGGVPCWRKCVTGLGYGVSGVQARTSVTLPSCCL